MRRCEPQFIEAGHCRHPEIATLSGGSLRATVFPALTGLFLHDDEGPILFDTGYDPAFFAATEPFPQRLYRWLTPPTISADSAVSAQLQRFGLRQDEIRWVVLSHFHGDHVAGLHAFPKARIACARAGLEAARRGSDWTALRQGVLRALIPADIDQRLVYFEDLPRIALDPAFHPFEEGADLFGGGSLVAVELPGHCPGHWGLACRGTDDRRHFLAADAAWSSRAIRENRPPPWLTTTLLGRTAPYRATLARLHALSRNAPEVMITPSHCAERAARIRSGAP